MLTRQLRGLLARTIPSVNGSGVTQLHLRVECACEVQKNVSRLGRPGIQSRRASH